LVNNSKFALWVGNSSVLESAYAITTNRWYHVSAWWDAGSMNIAVDGSINKTTVYGTYDASTLAGNLTLGGSGFNGILRTVRIWKSTVSGNISSSAIPVADPNLVGYWEINEGGLTSAVNFRFPAYPATASSASWATDSVQPGYYTWTRNGSDFPIASDKSNIYLKNLEKGRYEVTFIDPYNCPTTGISTFFNVLATDIVLPAISFAPATTLPLHVGTDAGDCSYLFDSDPLPANPLITDVEYYTPIVADLSGCDYTITWQVIPVDGNSTTYMKKVTDADPVDDRIKGMFVTREVTNGSNRVRVTVSQNSMTSNPPFEYYIIVDDIEEPKAKGKTTEVTSLDLDNTPGGGGKVTYYAWQFDGGSSDNCTKILKDMKPEFAYEDPILNPGTTWYESVNLGCSAIGNSVLLNYRVRDQANNPDPNYSDPISVNTSIPVKDVHKPVFNSTFVEHASVCAEDDDADALPAYTLYSVGPLTIVEGTAATKWKDYTDNCGVKHIQYKLVNTTCASCGTGWEDAVTNIPAKTSTISSDEKFYVGTTEVWYRLTDMDSPTTDADWTAQVMFKVVVLPQPTPGTTAPVSGGTTGIN
jgi:Concanavalin A-like lectin/glucanases superfamily